MIIRRPLILGSLACTAIRPSGKAAIPQQYEYAFQLYDEGGDRIRIESHYLRGKLSLDDDTEFRFQWLSDAITGSSPTGQAGALSSPIDDLRIGVLGAIARKFGDHRVELEVSRSSEEDYLSWGYALKDDWELNEKNTTLTFGVNYLNDDVSVPLLGIKDKESVDLFVGVSQVLDKNTFISANFTLGHASGYLNDPYKIVSRSEVVSIPDGFGGFLTIPVTNVYRENRPDSRLRQVIQLEGKHYFERVRGAFDAIYRFSHDDFGVNSHTVQLEWRQELGKHLYLTPFFRYYRQNAADFYVHSLDGVVSEEEMPANDPDGSGVNYSADYRLSALDTTSYGLRLHWKINETFSFNASYERYDMEGRGGNSAPAGEYPDADMWTFSVGAQF